MTVRPPVRRAVMDGAASVASHRRHLHDAHYADVDGLSLRVGELSQPHRLSLPPENPVGLDGKVPHLESVICRFDGVLIEQSPPVVPRVAEQGVRRARDVDRVSQLHRRPRGFIREHHAAAECLQPRKRTRCHINDAGASPEPPFRRVITVDAELRAHHVVREGLRHRRSARRCARPAVHSVVRR